jgi:hypothetical protein
MALFEITKPIVTTLIVDCCSEQEAEIWANTIVASLEDLNGQYIESNEIVSFDADVDISQIKILKLQDTN